MGEGLFFNTQETENKEGTSDDYFVVANLLSTNIHWYFTSLSMMET